MRVRLRVRTLATPPYAHNSIHAPPFPMSWQCEPGGQSVVAVQVISGFSGPAMQWCAPSTSGLLHPQEPQSPLVVQAIAQLPLPRHTWPAGHVAHATGLPQVLRHVPQRPAQVAPRGSGWQHTPPAQTSPAPQAPQEPPQPSLPQARSAQFGRHGPFFFRRRFLAPTSGATWGPATAASPAARALTTARRETPVMPRANASK